jgi:hypothetical protein
LNGWLCGNIATSPQALARFYFALFDRNSSASAHTTPVLASKYVALMKDWNPITVGWSTGLKYGLGLMKLDYADYSSSSNATKLNMVGHIGEDYGSQVSSR